MKVRAKLIVLFVVITYVATSQIAINTDASPPDPASILDLKSSDKGLLIPRMTSAQRDAIANPSLGLLVFVTDSNTYSHYNGLAWEQSSTHWKLVASDINYSAGNVGIGISAPTEKLDIDGNIQINNHSILFKDNENGGQILELSGSIDNNGDLGLTLRTNDNPLNTESIFRVISSGGTERLRVEHNGAVYMNNVLEVAGTGDSYIMGNLGININTPSSKFHLFDGNLALQRSNNSTSSRILFQNSNDQYNWNITHLSGDGMDDFSINGGNIHANPDSLLERFKIAQNGDVEISGSTNIGDINLGGESNAQDSSSYTGKGFTTTPWLYTHALEAASERGSGSTLLTLGADGTFGSQDEIHFITSGIDQAHFSSGGNLLLKTGNTIKMFGDNGKLNIYHYDNTSNFGRTNYYNSLGEYRLSLFVDGTSGPGGTGAALFLGDNGNRNVLIGYTSGRPNTGNISVYDSSGISQAGMQISSAGEGVVWADMKNFRMDHPNDQRKEIWYASIEGPEAGAYIRGTGELIDGKAIIHFPEHFSLVMNPTTLTLTLTPLSADSKGLAVVTKRNDQFEVRELMNGSGTYSFDWVAMAVRKGYEDYKVIREKEEIGQANSVEE